jgi:hypothetical protein
MVNQVILNRAEEDSAVLSITNIHTKSNGYHAHANTCQRQHEDIRIGAKSSFVNILKIFFSAKMRTYILHHFAGSDSSRMLQLAKKYGFYAKPEKVYRRRTCDTWTAGKNPKMK